MDKIKDSYVFVVEGIDSPIMPDSAVQTEKLYEYTAIVAKFGITNENGRSYQREDYINQIPYLKEKISKKMLMGELDHPQNYDTSLKNVSHQITDIWYDSADDTVKVRLKLLNTFYGRIAKSLIDDGVQISISSRSAGKVSEDGVVSLFKIFTFDLVAEPGFAQAQLLPVVNESFQNDFSIVCEALDSLKKGAKTNNLKLLQESKLYGDRALIYAINESDLTFFENSLTINNFNKNNSNSMNSNQVTDAQMNDFSRRMQDELNDLRRMIAEAKDEIQAQAQAQDAQAQAQDAQSQAQDTQSQAQDAQAQAQDAQAQAQNAQAQNAQAQNAQAQNVQAQAQNAQAQAQNAQAQAQNVQAQAQNVQAQAQAQDGFVPAFSQEQVQPTDYETSQPVPPIDYAQVPTIGADITGNVTDTGAPTLDSLSDKISSIVNYINYIAKTLENVIGHSNVVAENLNKSINYSETIGSTLSESINYQESIVKMINEHIAFTDILSGVINENASTIDKLGNYTNLIGSRLNETINLSNVIANKTQQVIEYSDNTAKIFNEHIDYTDTLANQINSTNFVTATVNGVSDRNLNSNVASIDEKASLSQQVTTILNKIEGKSNKSVLKAQFPFLQLLSESNIDKFLSFEKDTKAEIVATMNQSVYFNENDVMTVMNGVVESKAAGVPNYMRFMPDEYKATFESLSQNDKSEIIRNAESGFYRLDTPYQVKNFWREMRMDVRTTNIKESKQYNNTSAVNESHNQGIDGLTTEQFADYKRGYSKSDIQMYLNYARLHQ